MRRLIWLPAVVGVALAAWLFGFGGVAMVSRWAADGQHGVQDAMARALRALRAGEPGALTALWGLCFAYGFFHAAGPGHGKLVIGGYGLGRRVPMRRLMALSVLSSLAQALTAVALVYAGVLALGLTREGMQGLADRDFALLSHLMIAGIGLWLVLRGGRSLWRLRSVRPVAPAPPPMPAFAGIPPQFHDHSHAHLAEGAVCDTCGHAHGPTLREVEQVRSLRDAVILIAAIAARPCTGALFLLILTWRMGIDWAGIAGALFMGLGTATITLIVAVASVSMRESVLMRTATLPGTARALSLAEVLAGGLILTVAMQMALRLI